MLVAVGRNTHPHLTGYDETQAVRTRPFPSTQARSDEVIQRRKPSERVKAVEEYLVVYRKGWVELYKEWVRIFPKLFSDV